MAEFASRGVGTAGLTTGIIGSALGVMNSGLFNLFNNGCGYNNYNNGGCCSDDRLVTRYEQKQGQTIAEKDSEIALLKSEAFTEKKIANVFERLNVRLVDLEKDTAVNTQKINDNLGFLNHRIDDVYKEIDCKTLPLRKKICIDDICPLPMARYNFWQEPKEERPDNSNC